MQTQSAPSGSRRQRGQSTVEFMLMVPVLFAILFFVIEMGLYFTSVHYGTYAAFAIARSQEVGFAPTYNSVPKVANLILTGALWDSGSAVAVSDARTGLVSGVAVQLNDFESKVPFPFIKPLLPAMNFDTRVYLGPDERGYEGVEGRAADQYDNNL